MKKIEAVIRREKFEAVDDALKKIGVGGLTLEEVKGRGRTRLVTTVHMRGVWTQEDEYIRHIKLEIIAKDHEVGRVVDTILSSATTGSPGTGRSLSAQWMSSLTSVQSRAETGPSRSKRTHP